jgi:Mn-dependent DtxR family transcriptional regulator
MKVNRDVVLAYLRELEEKNGGYYGTDVINLAEKLGVTWYSLKKMIAKRSREDASVKSIM